MTPRPKRPVALLDVNLLVALFDADHVHHDLAHDWFADQRTHGWASCPITETGLVRVLSNPRYGSPSGSVANILDRLLAFRASGHHEFWEASVSLADTGLFSPAHIRGHAQVTDAYLLGLAWKKGGSLATFDRSISMAVVPGIGRETLQVIGAVEG
ncbi:MAG TPA: TA system VapC family ribonuclease toxin [Vicinamibacterales bacterium]